MRSEETAWAREEFDSLRVGDERRKLRLIRMATRAAEKPAGKISEVFTKAEERQGAYDLLESGRVDVGAMLCALGVATGVRAAAEPFAYVAIDGTSITLTDRRQTKDFGRVGNQDNLRGLKVINSYGITPGGVPLGLFTQVWWARPPAPVRTGSKKARRNKKQRAKRSRTHEQKEIRYWVQAIEETTARAEQTGAKLWFQLDREADCQAILTKLADSNHQFTVRAAWDRVIDNDDDEQRLKEWLQRKAAMGAYEIDVPAGPQRTARRARLAARWGKTVLRMRNERGAGEQLLEITVVHVREQRCPAGEKPLDWLLLTSAEVTSLDEARDVVFGYALRWRIESFHKSWKSGACNIEQTQLRSYRAVTVWATLLAAVAARIERLKLLARTEPNSPASVELDEYEIRALILLKHERSKKLQLKPIADAMPTIGQATLWIAELGGYTGRSSGGPPGAITIRRGLDYLTPAAKLLRRLEALK